MLAAAQLEAFARDGFVVVEGWLDDAECERLRARIHALVDAFDPGTVRSVFTTHEQTRTSDDYFLESGNEVRFFFEEEALAPDGALRVPKDRAINKIGHALHARDPVFVEFGERAAIDDAMAELGVREPRVVQSMAILKPPGIGGEVGWHQDATFLYTEPATVVGLWFALDDARRDNGCLWAIPGGHREGLRQRFVRAPGGGTRFVALDERPFDGARAVALEAPRGTMVALHGLLPHRSDANRSASWRLAYSVHAIDAAAHYPEDNWLRMR
jgi:phytanoyl-CoA hydroxylase